MVALTAIELLLRKLMHDRRRDDRRRDDRRKDDNPDEPRNVALMPQGRRLATIRIRLHGYVDAELRIPADLSADEVRQLCNVIAANAKA